MNRPSTGLLSNLKKLYESYGGFGTLIRSGYFQLSLLVSALCWRYAYAGSWIDLAKSILPTMAGFSIAAYAVFFAVLDDRARGVLREPVAELGGRSPLLILASSVSHAVVVQVLAILLALIFGAKPFPALPCALWAADILNWVVSGVGLFATTYGIVLILASVLSIFRVLDIRTRV